MQPVLARIVVAASPVSPVWAPGRVCAPATGICQKGQHRMLEKFTDRARRVVVLAQEEAGMLNHDSIGTEHILLGLIREGEGVAVRTLESLGIGLEAVRRQVQEIIGQGQHAPSGHIPFTPSAKKVLELALSESKPLATTTSAPSTSCSASPARAAEWPRRCW